MKKTEVKKVSFRVRRIYYDQFLAGTKHEELRALTLYWYRILRPHVSKEYYFHPLIMEYEKKTREYGKRPTIAVVHTPKQPTLYFQIRYIEVGKPEEVLGRELSEQGNQDIPTELCIVTKMGERREVQKQ